LKRSRLILISFLLAPVILFAQAQFVLTGAYVNISGGIKTKPIYLVIGNGANTGIKYTSGGIISESEFNMIWWSIGTNTGSYTVPFQYSNTRYIPLTYNVSVAGTGSGAVRFSTWHTVADNASPATQLPSDVTNMDPATGTSSPSATDDSYYVVDRFWAIDPTGYTTIPSPILTFSYINSGTSEIAAPNLITESNLIAQRFNSTAGTWGDYFGPSGTDVAVGGTGTVTTTSAIAPSNFFRSWTLTDKAAPLPIQLLSFTAQCNNGLANIEWSTATETNNNYFTIQKTEDGLHYVTVGIVKGAGTSSVQHNYSLIDNAPYSGTSYYSISQTDYDGTTTQKGSIVYQSCAGNDFINAFAANGFINADIQTSSGGTYTITLMNMLGQTLFQQTKQVSAGLNTFKLPASFSPGIYILRISNGVKVFTRKLEL